MAFDYKKEYKEFYLPPKTPGIIEIPEMNYVAVRGSGNPNEPDGEYKSAMNLLYGISFTIKMSYKGDHKIDGYFSYVVPPLEGLWWQPEEKLFRLPEGQPEMQPLRQEDVTGIDFSHKESFQWISMIRLPDFVTKDEFDWAVREATAKKGTDYSKAMFFTYKEGTCVQCMHIGSYDNEETTTIPMMKNFINEQGYTLDLNPSRFHHEIYLSDPRRTAKERLRTVIRLPVKLS